jgi:hypothetical protein
MLLYEKLQYCLLCWFIVCLRLIEVAMNVSIIIGETATILSQKFPGATRAECKRFLLQACRCRRDRYFGNADEAAMVAITVEAEKSLQDYLAWRKRFGMDNKDDNDEDIPLNERLDEGNVDCANGTNHDAILWEKACRRCDKVMSHQDASNALDANVSGAKASKSNSTRRRTNTKATTIKAGVPQFVFLHPNNNGTGATMVDHHGNKVLHVLPAMIDNKNVTAEYYGRTLYFYLDRVLARQTEETVTVLFDVRPGEGWPNPSAILMVHFIRKIVRMLQGRFPGRLEKLLVFPVPAPALGVFHAVQWAFHAELKEKIVLVSGSAELQSPLPKSELKKYISEADLDVTEKARLEKFLS